MSVGRVYNATKWVDTAGNVIELMVADSCSRTVTSTGSVRIGPARKLVYCYRSRDLATQNCNDVVAFDTHLS